MKLSWCSIQNQGEFHLKSFEIKKYEDTCMWMSFEVCPLITGLKNLHAWIFPKIVLQILFH